MDWIIGLAGIVFGGGVSWLVFFRASKKKAEGEALQVGADAFKSVQDVYQQTVADLKAAYDDRMRYIQELKDDRRQLLQEREELRYRIDKTDAMVRTLQDEVSKNSRAVETLRPFLCGKLDCTERCQLVLPKKNKTRS